jgi:uncharacterized protein YprB with RNaseH-like and TPR domain
VNEVEYPFVSLLDSDRLSEKLRAMGVHQGAKDLKPPRRRSFPNLDQALGGREFDTPQGMTYVVESDFPADHLQGRYRLLSQAPLMGLARWVGSAQVAHLSPQQFAFIDTETTGLSGGAGTYAFLIGVGRFDINPSTHQQVFHLGQFFMRDPVEEPAQLAALEQFIAPCQAVVSFNGKSFDLPLLRTRYITHGWKDPFADFIHLDLLHLSRRIWRDRLPSRTLGNLEYQILGAVRSEEDVPGWMVPALFFQYLRDGDPLPLKGVFYHNLMDVVSLSALMYYLADLLDDPLSGKVEHGADIIGLARLFEDLGDITTATQLYVHGLEHELPRPVLLDAIYRLSQIHKHQDELDEAVRLWRTAAQYQHLQSHVDLAIFYEHRQRDYQAAIQWTMAALDLVQQRILPPYETERWLADLEHRLDRLEQKKNR